MLVAFLRQVWKSLYIILDYSFDEIGESMDCPEQSYLIGKLIEILSKVFMICSGFTFRAS